MHTELRIIGEPAELIAALAALDRTIPGHTAFGVLLYHTNERNTMGEITVKDDETTLHASITLLDAEGHPTSADSPPSWASSDDTVVTAHAADDGLSATFDVGAPGSAVVTVTAIETHDGTGDPTSIEFTGLVNVVAGDAVTGSVEFAVD